MGDVLVEIIIPKIVLFKIMILKMRRNKNFILKTGL